VSAPSAVGSVGDRAPLDLRAGDKVAAHNHETPYVVWSVQAGQGRVQVADTAGDVHTYHQTDTVTVARPD
jgi:quercetin dioxygenase-like cupin family protein